MKMLKKVTDNSELKQNKCILIVQHCHIMHIHVTWTSSKNIHIQNP